MKKTRLFLLPILAMSFMALSSCTKDDINSLIEYGDSLAAADIHLQSQIDELKNELPKENLSKDDVSSLLDEVEKALTAKIEDLDKEIKDLKKEKKEDK